MVPISTSPSPLPAHEGLPASTRWQVLAFCGVLILLWTLTVLRAPSVPSDVVGAAAQVQRLDRAWVAGEPVALPWTNNRVTAPRWLQVDLPFTLSPAAVQAGGQAVCVSRWSVSAEVSLDGGRTLAPAASTPATLAHHLRLAHAVRLPESLQAGSHHLQLQLQVWPGLASAVGEVWLGEAQAVERFCEALNDYRLERVQLTVGALVLLGGLALLMAWLLREAFALWFVLMCMCWVVHVGHAHLGWLPLPLAPWTMVFLVTRTLPIPFAVLACYSLTGQRLGGGVRLLLAAWPAGFAVLALLPPSAYGQWLAVMGGLALVGAVVAVLRVLRLARASGMVAYPLLALALVAMLGNGAYDLLRWTGWVPYGYSRWIFFGVPLVVLAFVVLLVERLFVYIDRDRQAVRRLEAVVDRQRRQITADHAALQVQREQLLLAQERRRLLQNLHDGLGSHLVSASVLLRGGQGAAAAASPLVDHALMDLRHVLDVLAIGDESEGDDAPVITLLGSLRLRLLPAFEAAGGTLGWRCEAVLPASFLVAPEERLALLRLVQEALTNSLKHAQARQTTIELMNEADGKGLVLRIDDDGRGPRPPGPGVQTPAGQGLASMRARARTLGAELAAGAGPRGGFQVSLRWSLPLAAEAAEA